MAAISSFVFEIFADGLAGNSSREVATIKKKYLIILLALSSNYADYLAVKVELM